jgi:RHS repeat-associated protein
MPGDPGEWGLVRKHTYFYDGWNLVLETVAHTGGSVDRIEYVWGLDLSGTSQGAGGVGGLLFEVRNGQIFMPLYDANGNVTAYVDAYGNVRGHFEYDVFGNTIAMWGDLAHTFRFRFSTKYYDVETHSYYYGYRHYAPKLGCWLNRDPIGERGGLKLNGFAGNDSINQIDYLGKIKKEFKKLAATTMIFAETFGAVEPGMILTYECKCKKVEYDLFFHYTLRMLSKANASAWIIPPKEYPGESTENWGTWTIDQKYAFVLDHENKHVYWWRVFFDATVNTLKKQESFEFQSNEACQDSANKVIKVIYQSFKDYDRKQQSHYFWEGGH